MTGTAAATAAVAAQTPPNLNIETWETTTNSQCAINRYDKRGGEKAIVVGGQAGKRAQVTTSEREELNEERAATPELDIFRNGYLRPVRNVPQDVLDRFETETKQYNGDIVVCG